MAIIHVDGKTYEVDGADNLLQACLSLGLDVPYFCWHPALGSVGSCRQCAVKHYRDENDKMGRMVMSCMTPAADNTYISIADDEAREFRAAMISFVMTNHPHDCPVCEEGGHCHLQDMTVMSGHHNRSYRFTKRTHRNQELGPFIAHEMNRCIACYRCVRFYKDYAGGTDLGVFGSASRVYFGRETDGTLESEFSGNLTEVCPTGVFTDKTHSEHYTRKWDMQFAPGICSGCAVGCNISPGERYGEVRRIENRYNGDVNGYFLCDRGRFGYGHVNRTDRPRLAMQRQAGVLTPTAAAFDVALAALATGKPVIGIGSTRASIEGNHALRQLVGADNFYVATSAAEWTLTQLCQQVLSDGAVPVASIRHFDDADAALVLGEDLMATASRMALALRQTARGLARSMSSELKVPEWQAYSAQDIAQRQVNPVFVATPAATRFDDIARETLRATPAAIARLGYAVARAIDPTAPAINDLSAGEQALAGRIADALMSAKRPVVVSGCGSGSADVIRAAANVARALHARNDSTRIALVPPDANSLGVALMQPQALDAALQRAAQTPSVLIVLEADLFRQATGAQIEAALAQSTLIVVDQQMTATAQRADVLLPAASFAEGDGTLVNYEGRAQRHFQSFDPAFYDASVQTVESWRWLNRLASGRGGVVIDSLDAMLADVAQQQPLLAAVIDAAPGADFRVDGMRMARSPHRSSGRTSMRAKVFVHEPRSTQDADTALSFSMEGHNGTQGGDRPGALIPFAWSPGWNSPQAWNKFQDEVGGHLLGGDPGVLLLGPGSDRSYFAAPAALPTDSTLRVQPLRHIFGTEELSALAEPIQQRIPPAYAMLSLSDAQALGVEHDAMLKVAVSGVELTLPARVRIDFPVGLVGLPVGFAGMPALTAQATVTVAKAS